MVTATPTLRMVATFTVDLEWPDSALVSPDQWGQCDAGALTATSVLLGKLNHAKVKARFYVLGYIAERWPEFIRQIAQSGHQLGSHGYWHAREEHEGDLFDQRTRALLPSCEGYRSPYWSTTPRPGWSGGVFFRTLPYQWLKWEIERSGIFWIHPHDLYHAQVGPLRRRVFFCDPWKRLDRLLAEVDFTHV